MQLAIVQPPTYAQEFLFGILTWSVKSSGYWKWVVLKKICGCLNDADCNGQATILRSRVLALQSRLDGGKFRLLKVYSTEERVRLPK